MKITTRLKLLSIKKGIRGDVATIVLRNVNSNDPYDIARWMKDVVNNGVLTSPIHGFYDRDEILSFHIRNQMDIELIMFQYRIDKNIIIKPMSEPAMKVEEACVAFEQTILYMMKQFKLG